MDWNTLLHTITLLGAIQGLLLTVFLFSRKRNRPSNRFLGFYIATLIVGLLEPVVNDLDIVHSNSWLLDILGGLSFMYGPLLFLYVRQITGKRILLVRDYLIHFVPFISYNILLALVFSSLITLGGMVVIVELILYELLFIQIFIYLFKSLRIIIDFEKENRYSLSRGFYWLKLFVIFSSAVYLVSFLWSNSRIAGFHDWQNFDLFIQFALVTLVYLASTSTMLHSDENSLAKKRSKRSVLTSAYVKKLKGELVQYMSNQQPYLNKDFNLEVASKALNTNKYYLSQVINDQFQRNFSDFVNEYRISHFMEKLHASELYKYTIFGIASESGFNSKSAFNNSFKKIVGMTPSQYVESK